MPQALERGTTCSHFGTKIVTDYLLQAGQTLSPADAAVALIVLDDGRYLMQLRDQKPNIFYPGRWGVFGGAMNPDETPQQALRRELLEELGLEEFQERYFTRFVFDFSYANDGLGLIQRHYYEVILDRRHLESLVLGEGREMRTFSAQEVVTKSDVIPYDSLAIWMHATQEAIRLSPA
jgi:8-oxo-dGTP pyrophosphatase MutT (NUDIX family)